MGHFTEIVTFTAAEAAQIDRSRDRQNSSRPETFASAMVSAAISYWSSNPESDWGDSRAGSGHLTNIMTEHDALCYLGDNKSLARIVEESFVIPVAASADLTITQRRATLSIPSSEMLQEGLLSDPWKRLEHVRVLLGEIGHFGVKVHSADVGAMRKPVAKATTGKIVTSYVLKSVSGFRNDPITMDGVTHFDSLAAARAAGVTAMINNPSFSVLEVHPVQRRVAENVEPTNTVATITRPDSSYKLEVRFETQRVKKGAKPGSYFVAFDYHS